MTDSLQRVTTEYVDGEDRLRLSAQAADGSALVIWLTQRLVMRLVPVLLQWLERGQGGAAPRAEILQGWAQQAARAGLAVQPPVLARDARSAWLTQSIDIAYPADTVALTFRGAQQQSALLTLPPEPLRQWLNILYDAFVRAEWPLAVWPEWVTEAATPARSPSVALH